MAILVPLALILVLILMSILMRGNAALDAFFWDYISLKVYIMRTHVYV